MSFGKDQDAVTVAMAQSHPVRIMIPLAVGSIAVLITIFIHALTLGATVTFFRHERKLGRMGTGFWINLAIAAQVIAFAFLAHLIEIAVWAWLFIVCGEFQGFGIAYYHSAVNYTTLGYGDLIMSPSWRLLGPLEGADGALMFGVSTAMIFAITQALILAQFADLRN
jgi:Ion channel